MGDRWAIGTGLLPLWRELSTADEMDRFTEVGLRIAGHLADG